MNAHWVIRTGRLIMTPVAPGDLPGLQAIKADPLVFAIMLGGVRSPLRTVEELAADIAGWAAHGYGMWAVREDRGTRLIGIAGLHARPDRRGIALRFAFGPETQGRGLAREASAAALRFGHEGAGLTRIVAAARENNFASRTVLGGIGMTACETFTQRGHAMLLYESVRDHARCESLPLVAQRESEKRGAEG